MAWNRVRSENIWTAPLFKFVFICHPSILIFSSVLILLVSEWRGKKTPNLINFLPFLNATSFWSTETSLFLLLSTLQKSLSAIKFQTFSFLSYFPPRIHHPPEIASLFPAHLSCSPLVRKVTWLMDWSCKHLRRKWKNRKFNLADLFSNFPTLLPFLCVDTYHPKYENTK